LREGAKKDKGMSCNKETISGGGQEGTNKDMINIQASLKKYKKKGRFFDWAWRSRRDERRDYGEWGTNGGVRKEEGGGVEEGGLCDM
jgi:hypothetical protein